MTVQEKESRFECASPSEIDEWTLTKRALFKAINNKIALTHYHEKIR